MTGRNEGQPWTLADAAEFLGVSVKTLTRLREKNELATINIGRTVRIADSEVRRLATRGTAEGE